jgi:serine/threonine-protein kinase
VADRLSSTRAGTLKGKLAYMSPEQVSGAKDIDRTTDIFALGVVLWELTTNQRLFRMDTDLDTLEKVQKCEVPRPSTMMPGYPQELETIVLRALAKNRNERYQTARELSRAIQQFLIRRDAYVGPEEVAQFIKQVFADRIQKREQHLAWAAEVTSTINVDQLKGGPPSSAEEDDDLRRGRGAPRSQGSPASGVAPIGRAAQAEAQMAAASLMDDDEDVPTTVANRENQADPRSVVEDRPAAPRPAAGMPPAMQPYGAPHAMQAAPQPYGAPHGMQAAPQLHGMQAAPQPYGMQAAPQPYGMQAAPQAPPAQYPGAAQQQQQPYAARPGSFPTAQFPMQAPRDERTAAFPNSGDDDLASTVALPSPQSPQPAPRAAFGVAASAQQSASLQQPGYPGAGYAPPPYNGQGYSPQPQYAGAPGFSPGFPQAQGGPAPVPTQAFPLPQLPTGQQPQSQIETALSLPRPDPAALWMAQQDAAKRGQRRNTGVIVAVVALTALCLLGIVALVYFKMKAQPASDPSVEAVPSASATAEAAPTAAPNAGAEPSATPTASAAPTATAAASPAAPSQPSPAAPGGTAPTKVGSGTSPAPSASPSSSPDDKEEPGFLTIVCNPQCDDVLDNGRSLGPSPVVQAVAKPGMHRITLKRGTDKPKVISVIVVSGQVTAQRVSMK